MSLDILLVLAYAGTALALRTTYALWPLLLMVIWTVQPPESHTMTILAGAGAYAVSSVIVRGYASYAYALMSIYLAIYGLDCIYHADIETTLWFMHPLITTLLHIYIMLSIVLDHIELDIIDYDVSSDSDGLGVDSDNTSQDRRAGAEAAG